jgi:SanA protein
MKNDLMDKGISDTVLICDRNGISTMNSIRNLNKFKGEKFIIVSQKFHLERALYISGRNKTEALGYIADGSPGFRLKIRELLARLKMQAELMLY